MGEHRQDPVGQCMVVVAVVLVKVVVVVAVTDPGDFPSCVVSHYSTNTEPLDLSPTRLTFSNSF